MQTGEGACTLNSSPTKMTVVGCRDHFHIDWNRPVFLVTNEDGGILFDLDKDELLKLDPIAAQIWNLFSSGAPKSEVVEFIAGTYRIGKDRAAEDIDNLLNEAGSRHIRISAVHMIARKEPAPPSAQYTSFPWYGKSLNQSRPVPSRWGIFRAFIALLLFDVALSSRSLKFICKIVYRWRLSPRTTVSNSGVLAKVCVAVEKACIWYPKKAVCLQRSAVTACLLRSAGVPAELIIGARVMPLSSHAWVEVEGAVVNDHPKIREVYQRLAAF